MDQPRRFRLLWLSCGHLLLGVGAIGIFVPLLPTTPLWLLAAYCYSRSSEKFEHYILNHPRYGPSVRAFRQHGIVSRSAKVLATSVILVSGSLPTFVLNVPVWVIAVMWASLVCVLVFLWTRPESCMDLPTCS